MWGLLCCSVPGSVRLNSTVRGGLGVLQERQGVVITEGGWNHGASNEMLPGAWPVCHIISSRCGRNWLQTLLLRQEIQTKASPPVLVLRTTQKYLLYSVIIIMYI